MAGVIEAVRCASPNKALGVGLRGYMLVYYGNCGIPCNRDKEAVSSTLVDVVTRASGYPGTRECFHGCKDDAIL